jgi:hypothetical protein
MMMMMHLIRVLLGTSTHKEGAVAAVEEGTPKEKKTGHRKRTCHEREPSGKKNGDTPLVCLG